MVQEKYCRCRVCGFLFPGEIWEEGIYPTYDICPSCGCEAGNDDFTLEETREYRQKWIDGRMKWYSTVRIQPSDWDPVEQMKNIPPEWL